MSAPSTSPPVAMPARRRLRAFAFDPMTTRLSGRYLDVDVRFEPGLRPGPEGELLQVVDYDGTRDVWYWPVDLDDPAILAQGGLRPSEGDPRTHQQVVYAVAMHVLERLERYFGRRFRWRGTDQRLVLVPHAFEGRNAFFDPTRRAVLFGYYTADETDPGPNLPGQVIFTCLSVDIVAHEVSHAVVHRVRPHLSESTNVDVFAWHEAFGDLVALFNHFTFSSVVSSAIASNRADLGQARALFDLAEEFGQSTGRGAALRTAIAATDVSPAALAGTREAHARGAIFVAAVFAAYHAALQGRIADLLRLATGGTGQLPPGSLHPDLVARATDEAVKMADRLLGMVVRAFDFLPVVDVTFGDVVRSIVTADRDLFPDDAAQLRSTLVECLRLRGIYPDHIASLAEDALSWPGPAVDRLSLFPAVDLAGVIAAATLDLDLSGGAGGGPAAATRQLHAWAVDHAHALGLDPTQRVAVEGIHIVYRHTATGQTHPQVVAQLTQRRTDLEDATVAEDERLAIRAGTTVIAHVDGTVDHVITKPLPLGDPQGLEAIADPVLAAFAREQHRMGGERLARLHAWIAELDQDDPLTAWTVNHAVTRLTFAHLHASAGDA